MYAARHFCQYPTPIPAKIRAFPLKQIRDAGVCRATESEDHTLSSHEIIFEVFQPVCDHDTSTLLTDRKQTDGRTTGHGKTI